ncbi:hypothetical protein [Kordia sp.]|uniref:hypothetical protein n=1 Tax=Kordia sp. TaxID=1965332 RepID=UPI003D2DCF16
MADVNYLKTNIENWKKLTEEPVNAGIIPVLQENGNNFELTLDATLKAAERLHIYVTLDLSQKIQFYVIPHSLDTATNKSIYTSGLYPIPLSSQNQAVRPQENNILITWIDNWCNYDLRDQWLSKITFIPQVLVIHTADFIVNELHKCYFALRPNSNPTIPSKYRMDLVIQNTVTGAFLNPTVQLTKVEGAIADSSFEPQFADMARPVPPFGQEGHVSTDESNFGVLLQSGTA